VSEQPGADIRMAVEVPALPEFLYLVRLNTSGVASRAGFSYEEIEDLRLAIDELCFALIGAEGRDGTVRLVFQAGPSGLEIVGSGHFEGPSPAAPELSEWSEQILDALVDEYAVAVDDQGPRFRLVKRQAVVGDPSPR
jgi:serine/threonine-protein kinase RsbW